MRRAGRSLLGVLALALCGAAGDSAPALLERALEAYATGLQTEARALRLDAFRRAELLFERVVESGIENADLYVDLGNAALQAEHPGNAILAYRRALQLDPDHARALQNLAHARSLLPDWVPRPAPEGLLDSLFFWHRTFSPAERSLAAAVGFALAAALLAAALWTGQPLLRNLALAPALVWGALQASLLVDPAARTGDEAVVIAGEVVARSADSSLAPSPFPDPLPAGVELRIVERRDPWVRVRLANGRDAWLNRSALGEVRRAD